MVNKWVNTFLVNLADGVRNWVQIDLKEINQGDVFPLTKCVKQNSPLMKHLLSDDLKMR